MQTTSSCWWKRAQSRGLGFPLFPREVLGGVSDPKGMSRLRESSKCHHVTNPGSGQENPTWITTLTATALRGASCLECSMCFPDSSQVPDYSKELRQSWVPLVPGKVHLDLEWGHLSWYTPYLIASFDSQMNAYGICRALGIQR